jgi:hypothetical protein
MLSSYPLLFATVSGSHAYNFAGPASDYDIQGVHVLPLEHICGLDPHKDETIEEREMGIDSVTHDIRKFVLLLLKGNGNALEALYSFLVIYTTPEHQMLMNLAENCITKQVANHYLGMAFNQQKRMKANDIKRYLHIYRCLLMGIHIMETGKILMDVPALADSYHKPYIHQLIAWKKQGFDFIPDNSVKDQEKEIEQVKTVLIETRDKSHLPEKVSYLTYQRLQRFVVKARLEIL